MKRIEDFLSKLDSNQVTHSDKQHFLESLTKKEFIYFVSKKINSVSDTTLEARTDLFEEYINQTERIINQFNIEEIKKALPKIAPKYSTIKNMLLERFVMLLHSSKDKLDTKRLIEFKTRIEQHKITPEEIRETLLKMTKPEFSFFICTGEQEKYEGLDIISNASYEMDNMFEYQVEIIAELIEDYTEEEIMELIPLISSSSNRIRKMFFKCLTDQKAGEIFLTNAPRYSNDIHNYIFSPAQSESKDKLIIKILSDPNLYSLYSPNDIKAMKNLISNNELLLSEDAAIVDTTEEDIIAEAAKYLANLRGKDKPAVKRGVLKKLSAKKLYDLLNEVNKGLKNIRDDEITCEEVISLMEMPEDKAVLFLCECAHLTEQQKKHILNKYYKDNQYKGINMADAKSKVLHKYMELVYMRLSNAEGFEFIYPDLLEMEYNKEFFEEISLQFSQTFFAGLPAKCMNVLLAQLVEKEKLKLGLPEIKKTFYIGRAYIPSKTNTSLKLGAFNMSNNTININTNAFSVVSSEDFDKEKMFHEFFYKTHMIETVFHEMRHAYQIFATSTVSNMRELYFLLDSIMQIESVNRSQYQTNYDTDSREVDARLYAKVSTAQLLKPYKAAKDYYWSQNEKEAKKLAHQRRAPQLRNISGLEEYGPINIIDAFFLTVPSYIIKEMISMEDSPPMLYIIVDEEGHRVDADTIQEWLTETEIIMSDPNISNEDYEFNEKLVNFWTEYLKVAYNVPAKRRKIA